MSRGAGVRGHAALEIMKVTFHHFHRLIRHELRDHGEKEKGKEIEGEREKEKEGEKEREREAEAQRYRYKFV